MYIYFPCEANKTVVVSCYKYVSSLNVLLMSSGERNLGCVRAVTGTAFRRAELIDVSYIKMLSTFYKFQDGWGLTDCEEADIC